MVCNKDIDKDGTRLNMVQDLIIPNHKKNSKISTLVKNLFHKGLIPDYTCGICNRKTTADQILIIEQHPQIMIFSLQRRIWGYEKLIELK